jgi:transcriptional regulator with XRE-family HTH domain
MDTYDVRRKNLKLLIEQYEGPAALARKLGVTTSYISQLVKARRPISERTARDIEMTLRLTHGWFDGPAARGIKGPVAIDLSALSKSLERVLGEMDRTGRKMPPVKLADVVIFVYQETAKGATVDVPALLRLTA